MEQVITLGTGHAQGAAQGLDDLFGWVAGPALFETGDVVDGDPSQLREFLATQPGRASMTSER
jgi:hypothetical protein